MNTERSRREFCRLLGASGAAGILTAVGGCSDLPKRRNPSTTQATQPIPRAVPEGTVPLIAVEGTAYECGHRYGQLVLQRYPGYRRYLDMAAQWQSLPAETQRLFQQRAPYVLDIYRGLCDATASPRRAAAPAATAPTDGKCTSFGVAPSVTLDGQPISGQNKDTVVESAFLYIVLRMRIQGGPSILVLAYPGEVLGYGLWSTGMSLFRNNIYCHGTGGRGLTMEQWGLLALASTSVDEATDFALKHGISTTANCLISDAAGRSVNVESRAGEVCLVSGREGITTHANHPVGSRTAPYENYANPFEKEGSRYRMNRLWELLNTERRRLTPAKAMMCLADHQRYPYGLCRHAIAAMPGYCTTAAVVAEPTRGRLHVTRGNPCMNWPVSYSL